MQVGYSQKFEIAGQLHVYSNHLYKCNLHKILDYIVCLFHGGMHITFKQEKLFCAFQNISFYFEQLIAISLCLWAFAWSKFTWVVVVKCSFNNACMGKYHRGFLSTVFLTPYLQTANQTARIFPKYTQNKRGCFKFDARKYIVVKKL
jgi:hypothetical protein